MSKSIPIYLETLDAIEDETLKQEFFQFLQNSINSGFEIEVYRCKKSDLAQNIKDLNHVKNFINRWV